MKTARLLPLAALAVLVACSDTPTEMPANDVALEAAAEEAAASATRMYEVTITNHTGGQPLTPPLVATHNGEVRIFRFGKPASYELKEIAENGNLAPQEAALLANPNVYDVVVAVGSPPPVLPGGSITFNISGPDKLTQLSWASMLICTNDGFTGRERFLMPWKVGQTRSVRTIGYDAGTEINTEDFADMVPPCAALTGVPSSDPGTGMSNPALAENGKVRAHRGIHGEDDLDPSIHGWQGSVATLSVTRLQ